MSFKKRNIKFEKIPNNWWRQKYKNNTSVKILSKQNHRMYQQRLWVWVRLRWSKNVQFLILEGKGHFKILDLIIGGFFLSWKYLPMGQIIK